MAKVYIGTSILTLENSDDQYYLELIVNEIKNCLNSNAMCVAENPSDSVSIIFEIQPKSENSSELNIFYTSGNPESKRLASIIFEHMEQIYDDPSKMNLSPRTEENESGETVVSISFANTKDKMAYDWIRQNIEEISKQVIMSLDEYFGLPYVPCESTTTGVAKLDESIRDKPNLNSNVIGSSTSGKKIDVLGQWEDWYVVKENNNLGYIQTKFIEI